MGETVMMYLFYCIIKFFIVLIFFPFLSRRRYNAKAGYHLTPPGYLVPSAPLLILKIDYLARLWALVPGYDFVMQENELLYQDMCFGLKMVRRLCFSFSFVRHKTNEHHVFICKSQNLGFYLAFSFLIYIGKRGFKCFPQEWCWQLREWMERMIVFSPDREIVNNFFLLWPSISLVSPLNYSLYRFCQTSLAPFFQSK